MRTTSFFQPVTDERSLALTKVAGGLMTVIWTAAVFLRAPELVGVIQDRTGPYFSEFNGQTISSSSIIVADGVNLVLAVGLVVVGVGLLRGRSGWWRGAVLAILLAKLAATWADYRVGDYPVHDFVVLSLFSFVFPLVVLLLLVAAGFWKRS